MKTIKWFALVVLVSNANNSIADEIEEEDNLQTVEEQRDVDDTNMEDGNNDDLAEKVYFLLD